MKLKPGSMGWQPGLAATRCVHTRPSERARGQHAAAAGARSHLAQARVPAVAAKEAVDRAHIRCRLHHRYGAAALAAQRRCYRPKVVH